MVDEVDLLAFRHHVMDIEAEIQELRQYYKLCTRKFCISREAKYLIEMNKLRSEIIWKQLELKREYELGKILEQLE